MNATLIFTHRFQRDKKGNIYTINHIENTSLWNRYLKIFDQLTILARIQDVKEDIDQKFLISQENISFVGLPYFVGIKGFIKNYFKINKVLEDYIQADQAYICRLPNIFGSILIKHLRKKNIPYIVELVGDPWDLYSVGTLKNSMNPLFRIFNKYRSFLALKKDVKNAKGVIYVTESTLQKRYPAHNNAITTHASNVVLPKKSFNKNSLSLLEQPDIFRLLSIGSLEQLYKSPDIVLKAISKLKASGKEFHLIWLGDGIHKESLIQLSNTLGIENLVSFKGNVSPKEVFKEMENSHLYLHVSRTEGLPRAIIEAMAKGLACIGTRVGGIPELLDKDALIDKNNVNQLVEKIELFSENLSLLNNHARKNLEKAKTYEYDILEERREKVYKILISKIYKI
jgi:glycosyltransferase involved in cell wall biosynthesis